MNGNTFWRLLLTVVAIGASLYYVLEDEANLGLDLRGGVQVVLDLKPREGQQLDAETAQRTVEVLRNRVDALGVTEPTLTTSGNDRILVELPGVENPDEAVATIGRTAQLTVHPVLSATPRSASEVPAAAPGGGVTPMSTVPSAPPTTAAGLGKTTADVLGQAAPAGPASPSPAVSTSAAPSSPTPPTAPGQDQSGSITADDDTFTYTLGPAVLSGEGIADARAMPPNFANNQPSWYLEVDFKGDGAAAWTKLTGELACKPNSTTGIPNDRYSAFVLDGEVINAAPPAPEVACGVGITGNTTVINGDFTKEEVQQLALLIEGGALPVDVAIASQQTVGPTLGKEAIDASIKAVVIGGILTALFIIFYYRLLGLIAAMAVASYALISYAVLIGLNLTLTLPGIAGFVLAVAMAMDSNILVYERIKEEHAAGRQLRVASNLGYKNAFSAILDSNATTILAALTLFFAATGTVKGFGLTLAVGTAVSFFTTLIVLRLLTAVILRSKFVANRPVLTGVRVGERFRRRMTENPPDLMGMAKYFLAVSALAMIVSLAGVAIKGINYGIEFTGGELIEYSTPTAVDPETARTRISEIGFPDAVVQRSGQDDLSIRLEEVSREEEQRIRAVVQELGGGTVDTLREDTVGPSFGEELKRKAYIALAIGIGLQMIWIAIRFRWTYGLGAVAAMVHDALLLLGIWAWLQKPFDAVFLASMLTVIAFSVNDTVVIFDRIREQRRRRMGESLAKVISDACAQTIPRTINLSLSALFIIGTLYFFGGQTLSDFALALLVGIVLGVGSSVMVAAPISLALEKWKPAARTKSSSNNVRRTNQRRSTTGPASRTAVVDEDVDETEEVEATTRPVSNRPAPRPRTKSKKKRR